MAYRKYDPVTNRVIPTGPIPEPEPSLILPCDWCEEIASTKVVGIWCEADPTRRPVRLCKNCHSCCGAG